MTAYVIKHTNKDRDRPLINIIRDFKKAKPPHSYTSKKTEAEAAARGKAIYVIEVIREKGITSYKLGYKYISTAVHKSPHKAGWLDKYAYKNTTVYLRPVEGYYFNPPILIESPSFNDWLKELRRSGMTMIPPKLENELENEMLKSEHIAKKFTS